MPNNEPDPALTVYYDGGCPLCQREIAFYSRCRGGERVRWQDLSADDAPMVAPDLSRTAALARLHARRASGELVSGAQAFSAIWRSLDRFRFLGRIAQWPGMGPPLELTYRLFLRLRPAMQIIARRL